MRYGTKPLAFLFLGLSCILGGMQSLVLCFHADGNVHAEISDKILSGEIPKDTDHETHLSACMECTDIQFEIEDLDTVGAQYQSTVKVPPPALSTDLFLFAQSDFPMEYGGSSSGYLAADSPASEPLSQLISRTTVLRL